MNSQPTQAERPAIRFRVGLGIQLPWWGCGANTARPATGHYPYEIQRRQKREEESPAKDGEGKEAGEAGEKGQALIAGRISSGVL
jgi:hypothetical protein